MNSDSEQISGGKMAADGELLLAMNEEKNFIRSKGRTGPVRFDRHLFARLCPLT